MDNELEVKVDEMDDKLDALIKAFLGFSNHAVESFKTTDANFGVLEQKVDALSVDVAALSSDSSSEFGKVGKQLSELKVEVLKIQKVSNYSEEYENLLKISK